MISKRSYSATLIGLFISAQVFAEAATGERWSIDKIVTRAVEQTPEIGALFKDIESAENLARQAGKWDNPNLELSTGPMDIPGTSGRSLDISIRQNVPLFGQKNIAEKVGEQNRNAIELDSKKQIMLIKYEVLSLAIRFAVLDEQAKHTLHRREKINLIAKFLGTRPFASPSQLTEKTLILNRLREIEEKFLEISTARENTWKALNVFLNLERRIVPEAKWTADPVLPNREKLLASLEIRNPDLLRQKSLIEKSALEVNQANKRRYPDVSLGAGYNEENLEARQRTYTGTLGLTLPIIDRGGYAKRAALAEKESAMLRLEQKKRELLSEFDQNWTNLLQSKKRIELYPLSLVASLEKEMERTEQGWKKGLVPTASYLELENQVHEQAFKVYESQSHYVAALAKLNLLTGADFANEEK